MGIMTALFAPASPAGAMRHRRSLENPQTSLSDPAEWLTDAFGGGASAAGINVNRKTALTYAAFWRAVNILSDSTAKVPMHLYRRVKIGASEGKERHVEHPAYQLVRYKPNPFMTAETWFRTMTSHRCLKGNGYSFIERDEAARPIGLYPLDPDGTYPVRVNGLLGYVTHDKDGRERALRPDQVFHLKGLGFDGLMGYPILEYARDSLGMGMGIVQYQSKTFRNGARPSIVIQFPKEVKLTDAAAEKLRISWERLYSGIDNAGKAAVLRDGATVQPITMNAKDSQMIESAQQGIKDVSNWTGVPPHKLGDNTRNAYNSLEQENQAFLDDTIDPLFVSWEQECRDKLLTEDQKRRDTHVFEFLRQALVRANLEARGNFYAKAVGGPIMLVDEARSAEGWNPLSDEQRAKLYPPSGTALPGDTANNNGEAEAPAGDGNDTNVEQPARGLLPAGSEPDTLTTLHRSLVAEAAERIIKRIGARARRASKTSAKFPDFLDSIDAKHRDAADGMLALPIRAHCAHLGLEEAPAITTAVGGLLGRVRTSLDGVYSTVTEKRFADAVDLAMTELEATLPNEIADAVVHHGATESTEKAA